jgi:hypothetical protein
MYGFVRWVAATFVSTAMTLPCEEVVVVFCLFVGSHNVRRVTFASNAVLSLTLFRFALAVKLSPGHKLSA